MRPCEPAVDLQSLLVILNGSIVLMCEVIGICGVAACNQREGVQLHGSLMLPHALIKPAHSIEIIGVHAIGGIRLQVHRTPEFHFCTWPVPVIHPLYPS